MWLGRSFDQTLEMLMDEVFTEASESIQDMQRGGVMAFVTSKVERLGIQPIKQQWEEVRDFLAVTL